MSENGGKGKVEMRLWANRSVHSCCFWEAPDRHYFLIFLFLYHCYPLADMISSAYANPTPPLLQHSLLCWRAMALPLSNPFSFRVQGSPLKSPWPPLPTTMGSCVTQKKQHGFGGRASWFLILTGCVNMDFSSFNLHLLLHKMGVVPLLQGCH